jgi:adenylate cyclase
MSREEADLLERSARELSRVDELFHLSMAPQLAATLERQPERARLGGDEREVSVLFADLAGFTGFSEERPASEVVEMLNRYWAAAVPAVVGEGGLIDRFAGDATIVVFNAVTDQPDLSQDRPGCNGPPDGPDATCGDAPGQHQADWCCLTSTAG